MKKIYLARPDVFRHDANSYFDSIKVLLKNYGFTRLAPLDNEILFEEGELIARLEPIKYSKQILS